MSRLLAAIAALLCVLALAACGGDDEEPTTTSSSTTSTTSSTEEETTGESGIDDFGYPVNAHIQPQLGAVPDGIELDDREGTPPGEPAETDLEAAADAAGCDLELDLPDEGNTHFGDDSMGDYDTEPPTSGDHYAGNEPGSGALADGAYLETPPLSRAVHGLEHGRVHIEYSSDLDEDSQLELKGLFDDSPEGMAIFPNDEMPYEAAAAAWTNYIGCETYEGQATLDAFAAFRDAFRGNGPEPIPLTL